MALSPLRVKLAQINCVVGDIEGNTQKMRTAVVECAASCDLIVFPELAVTGYPPEDLLLRPSLQRRVDESVADLLLVSKEYPHCAIVFGLPAWQQETLFNAAFVLIGGQVEADYFKQCLPNYRVFDEKRYFSAGEEPVCVADIAGYRIALLICEDIWQESVVQQLQQVSCDVALVLNASPYRIGKLEERISVVSAAAKAAHTPIAYVNLSGGQDELVFDGASFVVNAQGEKSMQAPEFEVGCFDVLVERREGLLVCSGNNASLLDEMSALYQALVLGVRDYVNKNGFRSVVLGLSGGIDSALTLAIAVDALGADRVEAVMMPFRYTSQMSLDDAQAQASTLGVEYKVLPIEPMFNAFMQTLSEEFADTERDTTEENLQARCRGVMLMAISNKKGALVLTTGNKSEMSVGYATLYGDMAGGFDVLKDVSKLRVFALSRYRNTLAPEQPAIPVRVIERPPSAELAPDQQDSDSLPEYEVLDELLALYIEQDYSAEQLVAHGFDRDVVYRVLRLVDLNEYKRRQAAIGPRVTSRGFGRDRRYPITNGWKAGH